MKQTKQISRTLKGWDILKIVQDKKGRAREVKSSVMVNPLPMPKVRQDGLKHL